MTPPLPPPQSSLTKPHQNPLSDFIFSTLSLFILHSPNTTKQRRFIKFPITMPLTTTTNTTINRHNFPTPQSLSDWLKPRLPSDSLSTWGTRPGTKNVHNLWLELTDGEISLADATPPVRTLDVVVLRILDDQNRILIETHQELSNGDTRKRFRPLSEKMKPNETVEQAVFRAVKEELGSIVIKSGDDKKLDECVKIIPNSYSSKVEERLSVSYPGLPACYVLHSLDVIVDGLPDCEFSTEEDDEYKGLGAVNVNAVSCKKHYWKWVDSDTVSS
uniref:uncharacterized protein LOC122587169 n=1 Tax=Erigeron canadensis TaxID=72917 RepID=UPI001CB98CCF|nr:uncharacterized protein LOC122587169 [Erigeron canadensis]